MAFQDEYYHQTHTLNPTQGTVWELGNAMPAVADCGKYLRKEITS